MQGLNTLNVFLLLVGGGGGGCKSMQSLERTTQRDSRNSK